MNKQIKALDYDLVPRLLCDSKTRKPLEKDQLIANFRGEQFRVVGGCPPRKPGSVGYIDVAFIDDEQGQTPWSYYVTVFNAVWLGEQEVIL